MRILLINGGRPEDACGEALSLAEERLRAAGFETERFWPLRTEGLLCSGCGACRGAGLCVADPRGMDFIRAAAESGAFVLAAPAWPFGPCAQLQDLMRRASVLAARCRTQPLAGKPAAALLTGRFGGGKAAEKQTRRLLELCGMDSAAIGPAAQAEESLCALLARLRGTERGENGT